MNFPLFFLMTSQKNYVGEIPDVKNNTRNEEIQYISIDQGIVRFFLSSSVVQECQRKLSQESFFCIIFLPLKYITKGITINQK